MKAAESGVVSAAVVSSQRLVWFIAAEAVCLVGYLAAASAGSESMALLFLLGPLQVLAFLLLSRQDMWLLLFLAILLPTTALELLPTQYAQLVVYSGVAGLLLLSRVARGGDHVPAGSTSHQARFERLPVALLATWVILAAAGACLRGWWPDHVVRQAAMAIRVLLVGWFFASVPSSYRDVRRLLLVLLIGYAVVGLALPFLMSISIGGGEGKTLALPYATINMNALGAHIAIAAAIAVGSLVDNDRLAERVLLTALALVLTAALVLTKSRGAWLGFGIGFLYILIRAKSFWLVAGTLVAVMVLLSMDVLRVGFSLRLEATSPDDPALLGRLLFWKYALDVFKTNWVLGVGWENFRYVKHAYGFPMPESFGSRFNAHNIYIEMLVDLGIVGFISYVWLMARTSLRLDRVARALEGSGRGLAIGLNAALIVIAVHGMLDSVFWQHGAFMLVGAVVGIGVSMHRLARDDRRSTAVR